MRSISAFLIFLTFHTVYALDWNEKLKARVVKVVSKDMLIINRGIEDGVKKGDHARFYDESGFVTRGIAVERDMHNSYWQLFHTYGVNGISENHELELESMPRNLIPPYAIPILNEIKR